MKKTKKALRSICIVLLALIALRGILAICPRSDNFEGENPLRKDSELPILIAHGGGNKEFPDNTLEAFYNAYSVDPMVMMETDVSITKDGVVILSHDTTLDRKTNVTGAISDWNYSDLIAERVDFGYTNPTEGGKLSGERVHFKADGVEKYPTDVEYPDGVSPRDDTVFLATTLEELLIAFPENRINVEIKQSGELGIAATKECLRLLEEYDAFDRVVLASFHSELYNEYLRMAKENEVPDSFMFSPGTAGAARYFILYVLGMDMFFSDGIAALQLPMEEYGIPLATKGLVKSAASHNVATHFWTINDKDDMRKLVEIGADGIMTDYPHRLKEVLEEYK